MWCVWVMGGDIQKKLHHIVFFKNLYLLELRGEPWAAIAPAFVDKDSSYPDPGGIVLKSTHLQVTDYQNVGVCLLTLSVNVILSRTFRQLPYLYIIDVVTEPCFPENKGNSPTSQ